MNASGKHVSYERPSDERDLIYQVNHMMPNETGITVRELTDIGWPIYLARVFLQLFGKRVGSDQRGYGSTMIISVEDYKKVMKSRPEWAENEKKYGAPKR